MATVSTMYEFEAIGTHWWLERLDGGEFTPDVQQAIIDYTAEFDRRYSRFRDDSLVAELALGGRLQNPPVEMISMLEYAKELSETSDGAFSLLVGNTLQSIGYGQPLNHVRTVLTKLDSNGVIWGEGEVRVPKRTMLDFGGFGKGWMIDEYVRILRDHGAKEFIVNGGGDLYVQASKPISFALEHPYNPKLKIGDIKIQKGALAASSTTKRAWKRRGKMLHHIIDPATGKPSETDIVATFVCAHTALVADSLATILIIRPDLEESLETRYNAETLLIMNNQVKA